MPWSLVLPNAEPGDGYLSWPQMTGQGYRRPSPSADDVAVLIYTSGTTPAPKGVPHSHNSILAEQCTLPDLVSEGGDVVQLVTFPPGHIAGGHRHVGAGKACDRGQYQHLPVSKRTGINTYRCYGSTEQPTITDRIKDVIIRGAETISSGQVEDVLNAHPRDRRGCRSRRAASALRRRGCPRWSFSTLVPQWIWTVCITISRRLVWPGRRLRRGWPSSMRCPASR